MMEEAPVFAIRCSSSNSPAHLLHIAKAPVQAHACIPTVACFCSPAPPLPCESLCDHKAYVDPHLGREGEGESKPITRRRRLGKTKT